MAEFFCRGCSKHKGDDARCPTSKPGKPRCKTCAAKIAHAVTKQGKRDIAKRHAKATKQLRNHPNDYARHVLYGVDG